MKLTKAEKLILLMLSEIYDKLGLDSVDTGLLRKAAIHGDNTWALEWEGPHLEGEERDDVPPYVQEVMNCLDMWEFLERAWKSFDPAQKDKVRSEVELFGKDIRFPGFDGNNESELLTVAQLVTEDLQRFQGLGTVVNSHAPLRSNYQRMYAVFKPMRLSWGSGEMSPQQVIAVMKQMAHPDQQK